MVSTPLDEAEVRKRLADGSLTSADHTVLVNVCDWLYECADHRGGRAGYAISDQCNIASAILQKPQMTAEDRVALDKALRKADQLLARAQYQQ